MLVSNREGSIWWHRAYPQIWSGGSGGHILLIALPQLMLCESSEWFHLVQPLLSSCLLLKAANCCQLLTQLPAHKHTHRQETPNQLFRAHSLPSMDLIMQWTPSSGQDCVAKIRLMQMQKAADVVRPPISLMCLQFGLSAPLSNCVDLPVPHC